MLIIKDSYKKYSALMKYALNTCSSFSLVFEKDDYNSNCYISEDIYLLIKPYVNEVISIGKHPDTGTCFLGSDFMKIDLNNITYLVLMEAQCILDWNGERFPEELCFYRKSHKWLTSISHERLIQIHNYNSSDIKFLESEDIPYQITL